MRKNIVNFKYSAVLLVTLMIISLTFVCCTKDSDLSNDVTVNQLPYLTISSTNSNKWTKSDMQAYGEAFKRLKINKTNGVYETQFVSGSQVNISEVLFNQIKELIYKSSKISNIYSNSSTPRLKTPGENSGSTTDCVQQAIWLCMSSYGSSSSYDSVNSWATSEYGNNGINGTQNFTDACDHFLNGQRVTIYPDSFNGTMGYPAYGTIIVVIRNPNNPSDGHAGILNFCLNGAVFYTDKDGQKPAILDNVVCAYQAWGCESGF